MKNKTEAKKGESEFDKFDNLLRQVVSVPKDEIKKREQEEKQNKAKKKA